MIRSFQSELVCLNDKNALANRASILIPNFSKTKRCRYLVLKKIVAKRVEMWVQSFLRVIISLVELQSVSKKEVYPIMKLGYFCSFSIILKEVLKSEN